MPLDLDQFATQFERFKALIEYNGQGHPFVSFREGLRGRLGVLQAPPT